MAQLQFLNLPQIDAAAQQYKTAQAQNALAPFLLQQAQRGAEMENLKMQQLKEGIAQQNAIKAEMAKFYAQGAQPQNAPMTTPEANKVPSFEFPKSRAEAERQFNEPSSVAPIVKEKPKNSVNDRTIAMLNAKADIYERNNDSKTAAELRKQAKDLLPKFNTTPQRGADGKSYVLNDQGEEKQIGFTLADEIVADDMGGEKVYRTKYSATPISKTSKTLTPEAVLTDNRTRSEGAANRAVTTQGQVLKYQTDSGANKINGGKQIFEAELKLGDDHKAASKIFKDVADATARINSVLPSATKSAAATLAGATSFMKLLDPGSVVRESELGMALAATGALDRATNYFNTLQRGKVLTDSQAKDFQDIASKVYAEAEKNQRAVDSQFIDQSNRYGLNPKNVVKDYYLKPKIENKQSASVSDALNAIKQGAPKAAVIKRLEEMGITNHGIK